MDRDLTKELPIKQIIKLMIPLLLSLLGQQFCILIETRIIGQHCTVAERAGMNSTGSLSALTYAIYAGIALAISIIISQVYGNKNKKKLRESLNTSIIITGVLSIAFTVIGLLLVPTLLNLIETPKDIYSYSYEYIMFYFAALIFQITFQVNNSIFNAIGNSKSTLKFIIVGNILNIILDYILIVKCNLGVVGAGIALLVSNFILSLMSYVVLIKWFKKDKIQVFKKGERFNKHIAYDMIKLVIPSIGFQFVVSVASMLIQVQYNKFPNEVIGSIGICSKIITIVTIATTAIMKSVVAFTGQNIGAQKVERIKQAHQESIILGMGLMFLVSGIVFIFSKSIISFFISDPISIAVATQYLKINSIFFILTAINNVNQAVLRGASDMDSAIKALAIASLVKVIFVYVAVPRYGLIAIYLVIPVFLTASTIASTILYRIGYWEHKKIKTLHKEHKTGKYKECKIEA